MLLANLLSIHYVLSMSKVKIRLWKHSTNINPITYSNGETEIQRYWDFCLQSNGQQSQYSNPRAFGIDHPWNVFRYYLTTD